MGKFLTPAELAALKAEQRQQAQLAEKTETELLVEAMADIIYKMQIQLDKLSKGDVPRHPRDIKRK